MALYKTKLSNALPATSSASPTLEIWGVVHHRLGHNDNTSDAMHHKLERVGKMGRCASPTRTYKVQVVHHDHYIKQN
jgi:hypothetical protein